MAAGVAGNFQHAKTRGRLRDAHFVAVRHALRGMADAFVVRGVHRYRMAREQLADAADVVVVMMGQQDRAQAQPVLGQRGFDRSGFTGIDRDRVAGIVVQQPDVVVGERR
jgi:hypothetical protein